jgi:S1-C subfamily serine protease
MIEEIKPVVISIQKARERGVVDDLIFSEIRKQNPEKERFFEEAERRGVSAKGILDEIIKQNTFSEEKKEASEQNPIYSAEDKKTKNNFLLDTVQKLIKSKKSVVFLAVGISLFFILSFLFFYLLSPIKNEPTDEQLLEMEITSGSIATLASPSVVKIGLSVSGEITIYPMEIDIESLFLIETDGDPVTVSIEELFGDYYSEGTGFIVDPNGIILTNAHVVSDEMIKMDIMRIVFENALLTKSIELSLKKDEENIEKIRNKIDEINEISTIEEMVNWFKDSKNVFDRRVVYELEKKIVVFNPNSDHERLPQLAKEAFDADILFINEEWIYDNKDIALIKIKENNLPSVSLSERSLYRVGDPIYLLGFPSTSSAMDVSRSKKTLLSDLKVPNIRTSSGYLTPSFTVGQITAFKSERMGKFDYIELDAKGAAGSSGSPVFNSKGEVIGIVTIGTPRGNTDGDFFIRALPIKVIEEIDKLSTNFVKGDYYYQFKRGLYFARNKRCKRAIEEFTLLNEKNSDIFLKSKMVESFIESCKLLIENKGSVDTRWDLLKERIFGGK